MFRNEIETLEQNGITAMIPALFLEKDLAGTVGIGAPGIIIINLG